ncbi:MAG: hypothetical protein HYS25_02095 [Ignavibacteriales bacterium]|nr:hypothetical protein [Ignavibacteriales bacterium]
MKKKLSSYFLISFLLFFPLLIYSQTIIKEKVTVSPKKSSAKIPDAVQDESQLEFQIGGALPLTAAVVGPTTTQSGSSGGGANPYVYLYFPPLNGNYQITISSTLSAGQTTNVNYVVSYQGQGISYGDRTLYNGGEETAVVTTTISVTIGSFPEETPVDFSLHINNDYICSNYESGLSIVNYNQPITSTTNVKFNINSVVPGVELYNKNSGEIITSGTSVHILDVPNLSIRLSTPYQGSNANEKVSAEIGGVTRTDSLIVIGTGNYFRLYSEKRIWDMLEGGTIEMLVELQGESSCDDVRLQDTTKYNLLITQGQTFGHIKHPVSGELVTEAVNLSHENGKLKFKFTAAEELLLSEAITKVTVTTNNPAISPYEFVITIHKEGMIVTFVPETIMPGDTASVILKKKNPDGTLSDFPEDQYFDAEIIVGAEYGTLYVAQWGDLSDYFLNIPQGFKFIAEEGLGGQKVESTILVRTTAGIIWGRVTPGKTNNQNSVQNTADEEQLWGEGTITIGEGGDCSDAPQCEELTVPPTVSLNAVYKNGDFGIDHCSSEKHPFGYFHPLIKDKEANITFENYLIDVCFNPDTKRWQASVGSIAIKAIEDLCPDNIYLSDNIVIENLEQVKQKITTKEKAEEALKYFFYHTSYPGTTKIILKEFIEKHEHTHMEDFAQNILPKSLNPPAEEKYTYNNVQYSSYSDLIKSFGPECNDNYNNITQVKNYAQQFFYQANELLRIRLKKYYRLGDSFEKESEINTSETLMNIIIKYQNELIRLYPDILNTEDNLNYYLGI